MRERAGLEGWGTSGRKPAATDVREPALAGALPSAWGGRCQRVGREAAVVATPFACHSTTGALLLWRSRFPSRAFPVEDFLTPIPSGCPLLTANSSSLPGSVLQTPHSSTQSLSAPGTHFSGWDTQGCGSDTLFRSHSVLPATVWLLHSPQNPRRSPSVPADLLSVRRLPQMREPLLSFSSPQGCRSRPVSSPLPFFLVLSFVLPGYVGIFLVLLGVRRPLVVFSGCSVRIVPFVGVFFFFFFL